LTQPRLFRIPTLTRPPPPPTPFPYPTLFRSLAAIYGAALTLRRDDIDLEAQLHEKLLEVITEESDRLAAIVNDLLLASQLGTGTDRKSTRLNSSHVAISYAVFCLKKKIPHQH